MNCTWLILIGVKIATIDQLDYFDSLSSFVHLSKNRVEPKKSEEDATFGSPISNRRQT
jgi:hypothetical protein